MLKNKLLFLSPIIVSTIILLFSLTLIPSVNPEPTNLPIAIVNEDEGVIVPNQGNLNIGANIVESIEKNTSSKVKWITVENYKAMQKGLDSQKYYGALYIPKDFSAKQASLRSTAPVGAELQLFINQGMNTMGVAATGQILQGVTDYANQTIRAQLLSDLEKQGGMLSPKQAAVIASPILKKVINVNEIGTHSANGNAPVTLFQPLWMASIGGAAVLFLAGKSFISRKERLYTILLQITSGLLLAFLVGFGLTWIADNMLGMNISSFTDMGLFLSVTYFSFFLMISAVLSWIGFKGIPIFIIILFFGAPLLSMAPEFMSAFYRDYIYSWLPMRFMTEGLRELFFFDAGFSWNTSLVALTSIGIVSLLVLLASTLKITTKEKVVEKSM
ncbi:DUF3533 domain-containing protein [Ectobacillus sp. JY-23]|uniref:YhgE/Pip domain-containing protein n=1 Tax=Ectobacillus sp. JY-23 TaxID=2933872 RepID=UPI001FF197AA|nr:DUF3533 domain-containing protein [Ectobacillus sp. JY-23]UOY94562.1 DUF3533 domain-containing protein [Ectobacillus sp. JY-23]